MNLKQVQKRNGDLEIYDMTKLVNKATWAVQGIEEHVNWPHIVLEALSLIVDEVVPTKKLDESLISHLISEGSYYCNLAAGRIYLASLRKTMWWNGLNEFKHQKHKFPTVKQMHTHLIQLGLMADMGYSDKEYKEIEKIIDHSHDTHLAYFQIKQIYSKYSLKNTVYNRSYELPQFVYMRMAMEICSVNENKLSELEKTYNELRETVVAPTTNYTNFGTPHRGFGSCCIYTSADNRKSMAAGKHIAYTMTYMSAGIGNSILCRSEDDPVRGGAIRHRGKEPYYFSMGGDVTENKQGPRAGACTTYFNIHDPDVKNLLVLQNPRTPVATQNRLIHFAMTDHPYFAELARLDREFIPFNAFTAPEVFKAFYGKSYSAFVNLYENWQKKNRHIPAMSAREIATLFMTQRYEVGTEYWFNVFEANRHTPYLEPIHSSNLCTEIMEVQKPYKDVLELYREDDDVEGEVAMCNLAAICLPKVMRKEGGKWVIDDMKYRRAVEVGLEMVDYTIEHSHYELPHVGYTAKKRRNAGVGIIGRATVMAQNKMRYDSVEGRNFIHELAETHMWHLINASIDMGIRKGNAPWMHKTKWPKGWLPIDTYNRNVDQLVTIGNKRDWNETRKRLTDNKGMRFSVLASLQPTESSSKSTPYPNSTLPVRELFLRKTDGTNAIEWVAYQNESLGEHYQLAWDIPTNELIKCHSVDQKWLDQGGSFDTYRDRRANINFSKKSLLEEYFTMHQFGMKSAYYGNSITTNQSQRSESSGDCASGACKM